MSTSQNGWPALASNSPKLYRWKIPSNTGVIYITLRNGSGGFLLAYLALWFSEKIQALKGAILDDWGYAYRPIRDDTDLSNHASGTAEDLNALKHPLGAENTFGPKKEARLRRFLMNRMKGAIRWGGDYRYRKDEMHFELVQDIRYCEKRARWLMRWTRRGRRLIKANPSQKAIILS